MVNSCQERSLSHAITQPYSSKAKIFKIYLSLISHTKKKHSCVRPKLGLHREEYTSHRDLYYVFNNHYCTEISIDKGLSQQLRSKMCLHSKFVSLFYYNCTILGFIKNSLSEKKYTTNIAVERFKTSIQTTTWFWFFCKHSQRQLNSREVPGMLSAIYPS